MTLPLIITAPHVVTTIPRKYRYRVALSNYEIWQFNDPFTDQTCEHPDALKVVQGKCHRLLCDLSHGNPPVKPFRTKDFYGRNIYHKGSEFTDSERTSFLKKYAIPYRQDIVLAVKQAEKLGHKKILVVDHHNTAADHAVGKTGLYMPGMIIANGGDLHTGTRIEGEVLSCPSQMIQTFKRAFDKTMPFQAEINSVYRMSHTIRWLMEEVQPRFKSIKIYGLFLEYNLNFIHNPITKKNDHKAKIMIRDGINQSLNTVIKKHF